MSKILDNNDYNLQIAPSYQENLAHARWIWNAHERPLPILNGSLHHTWQYKVFTQIHFMFWSCPLFSLCCTIHNYYLLIVWKIMHKFNETLKPMFNVDFTKECMSILLTSNLVFTL
jgi:hypothetical protein